MPGFRFLFLCLCWGQTPDCTLTMWLSNLMPSMDLWMASAECPSGRKAEFTRNIPVQRDQQAETSNIWEVERWNRVLVLFGPLVFEFPFNCIVWWHWSEVAILIITCLIIVPEDHTVTVQLLTFWPHVFFLITNQLKVTRLLKSYWDNMDCPLSLETNN